MYNNTDYDVSSQDRFRGKNIGKIDCYEYDSISTVLLFTVLVTNTLPLMEANAVHGFQAFNQCHSLLTYSDCRHMLRSRGIIDYEYV